tara:strand:+ start:253 stop:753 length:501 start_codon:yes stop_codon:yes gene_type:complete
MAFVINDRVKESSTTSGQVTIQLGGASQGFVGFVAGIGNSNSCYYTIAEQGTNNWEVGIGTVTDAATDTLSRDTVLSNSLGNTTKINFQGAALDVFCTYAASKTPEMTLTTTGDTLYASAANTPSRLALGSAGQILTVNSGASAPEWATQTASVTPAFVIAMSIAL